MELYTKLLIFYVVMAVLSGVATYFLARDNRKVRLLSALLIGATWPISFPVALLFSLF
ncbi:GhoT/OrtT family toxin [Kosakonia sp. MUSA4]|uniref:GhoT/OrtT family toxin n=1 Tax=Kosakonia sp. MUSA4 TaxID=2067958 RepID=UPI000943DB1A|nr:GhoT/OrtT family toxin [Kosakonia sp. MUSA4]QJT80806.1 GhoT/OrtT family toxin [Kosakonia sp. MUSA4]